MAEYTKRDIAKILEKSARTIMYWTDIGLVIPDIQPSGGRGITRLYSDRNLLEFAIINILTSKYNITLGNIAIIMEILRHKNHNFYEDSSWGNTKEMVFHGWVSSEGYAGVEIINKVENEYLELNDVFKKWVDELPHFKTSFVGVLFLGSVKKEALKALGWSE